MGVLLLVTIYIFQVIQNVSTISQATEYHSTPFGNIDVTSHTPKWMIDNSNREQQSPSIKPTTADYETPCMIEMTHESQMKLYEVVTAKNSMSATIRLKFLDDSVEKFYDTIHDKKMYRKVVNNKSYGIISDITRWTWIHNTDGLPLLMLDFRYVFYSMGILSLQTYKIELDIVQKPSNCFSDILHTRTGVDERMMMVYSMFSYALNRSESMKLNVSSSVCYNRLAECNTGKDEFYLQYVCCQVSLSGIDYSFSEQCRMINDDKNESTITILYMILFLLSPLLIKYIPKQPNLYVVNERGEIEHYPPCQKKKMDAILNMTQQSNNQSNSPFEKDVALSPKLVRTDNVDAIRETIKNIEKAESKESIEKMHANTKKEKPTIVRLIESVSVSISLAESESLNNSPGNAIKSRSFDYTDRNTEEDVTRMEAGFTENWECFQEYIPLNSITPARITRPFSIIMSIRNTFIGVIRRAVFFLVIYPIFVYVMIAADIVIYGDYIQLLYTIQTDMNIPGKLHELDYFDHFWLGDVYTNPAAYTYGVVFFVMYTILSSLLIARSPVKILDSLMVGKEYLGIYKLPHALNTPRTNLHGFHKLYNKMKYRLGLVAEPRFWMFWLGQFRDIFFKWRGLSKLDILLKPVHCILLLFSLCFLLPIFNILPLDTFIAFIKHKSLAENLAKTYLNKYHSICKPICYLLVFIITIMGVMFAGFIFLANCRIGSKVVLYTIKGFVKNYTIILPIVSTILVGAYYVTDTVHNLEKFYKDTKLLIFDECQQQQNKEDNAGYMVDRNEPRKLPIYIIRSNGIPLIPKRLYSDIINQHVPVREYELPAIGKLIFIGLFLFYVAEIIDLFSIRDVSGVGQALATFMAVFLPKVLDYFSTNDNIHRKRLQSKIRAEVIKYSSNKTICKGKCQIIED